MRCVVFALFLSAVASAAAARGLIETHFGAAAPHPGGCFVREYAEDHLARHPDQRVTFITLAPVPLDWPEGGAILNVMVRLRGGDFASGTAYCEAAGKGLACGMEGDAGSFTLAGRADGALLLTVGRHGISFETEAAFVTLEAGRGDDREFLIPNVDASACR
jgi:hypothetical protein